MDAPAEPDEQQSPPDSSATLQDIAKLIRLLEEHRLKCQEEGNYVEADLCARKLDILRRKEESRRKDALKIRQRTEKSRLEDANSNMVCQFNVMWGKEVEQFEAQSQELESSMRERHALEFREFQRALESEPKKHPKFSRELLNLRKIQETLAKQKEYTEAHKVKVRADAMEDWELKKLEHDDQTHVDKRLQQFRHQQAQEYAALHKRLARERQEMLTQRQSDYDRINRRFRNVHRELTLQQRFEKLRLERQRLSPTRVAEEGDVPVQMLLRERHSMSPRTSLTALQWARLHPPASAGPGSTTPLSDDVSLTRRSTSAADDLARSDGGSRRSPG